MKLLEPRASRHLFALAFCLALSLPASASVLEPGSDITVLGTNVFSGPALVAGQAYAASDSLRIAASGTVDLAAGNFTANAAGIIVAPPVTNTGANPGQTSPGPGGIPFAALLVGNGSLGFVQLFPSNALNGLGDSTPPTDLVVERTFLDLFGTGIAAGTALEFRVNDSNNFDNSGSFLLSAPAADVPEPSMLMLLLGGALLLAGLHVRRLPAAGNTTLH